MVNSPAEWTTLLDKYYVPDGIGSAFIVQAGRGVYVMNTRENVYQEQTFRLPSLPKPVRGVEATRKDGVVALTWPARAGDVAYRVYKRVPPQLRFALAADDIGGQEWTDTAPDAQSAVAYAVTALTNEEEPFEGGGQLRRLPGAERGGKPDR